MPNIHTGTTRQNMLCSKSPSCLVMSCRIGYNITVYNRNEIIFCRVVWCRTSLNCAQAVKTVQIIIFKLPIINFREKNHVVPSDYYKLINIIPHNEAITIQR